MKKMAIAASFLFAQQAAAEIIEAPETTITRVIAYDDVLNGAIVVLTATNHISCPIGAYINPAAPGAKSMVATALAAASAGRRVVLQLYTDRMLSGRCEIDAIHAIFD